MRHQRGKQSKPPWKNVGSNPEAKRRRQSRPENKETIVNRERAVFEKPKNKRKRERGDPRAGDNRAEPNVANRESGKGEADSGLTPTRKGEEIRQANTDSEAPIYFSEEDDTDITRWKIRTTRVEVRLIAQHTLNYA